MPRRSQPTRATNPTGQAPSAPTASGASRPLVALSEARQAAAVARFELLKPHLHHGVPLVRVAKDAGLSLRTVQRWLTRYRADGWPASPGSPMRRCEATRGIAADNLLTARAASCSGSWGCTGSAAIPCAR